MANDLSSLLPTEMKGATERVILMKTTPHTHNKEVNQLEAIIELRLTRKNRRNFCYKVTVYSL